MYTILLCKRRGEQITEYRAIAGNTGFTIISQSPSMRSSATAVISSSFALNIPQNHLLFRSLENFSWSSAFLISLTYSRLKVKADAENALLILIILSVPFTATCATIFPSPIIETLLPFPTITSFLRCSCTNSFHIYFKLHMCIKQPESMYHFKAAISCLWFA